MPINGLQPQVPINANVPRANWNQPTMVGMNNGMVNPQMMNNASMPQQLPGMPQINRAALYGRIVNTLEEITVQDVPQDGSASFFPMADYSCVFAKQWGSNGLIQTVKYIPESIDNPDSPQNQDITAIILQRLDSIEEMLKKNRRNNFRQNKSTEKEGKINADT